jgi:hypothetical protein
MKFVSLGSSCGVTVLLQSAQLKGPNCPFDWALTSPQFVLEMTKLAHSNLSSKEIIQNHFFTGLYGVDGGQYLTVPNGMSLANTELRAIFPHEDHRSTEETIEAYIRRMDRFRILIQNPEVTFIWAPPGGTPIFNDRPIVEDLSPLNDLCHLVNGTFHVFCDTDFQFSDKIRVHRIEPSENYGGIAGQISEITNNGQVFP